MSGKGFCLDRVFVSERLIDFTGNVQYLWAEDRKSAQRNALSSHAALVMD
jgi:hypothetical protein